MIRSLLASSEIINFETMEIDELLSRFHDDTFGVYRDALKNASLASSMSISSARRSTNKNKKKKTSDSNYDTDNTSENLLGNPYAITTDDLPDKAILKPEYDKLDAIKSRLVEQLRHSYVRHSASERRLIVSDDDQVSESMKDYVTKSKALANVLTNLSNVLAYEVILTRQIPESRSMRFKSEAVDLLDKRSNLIRSIVSSSTRDEADTNIKKTENILEETEILYRNARRALEQSDAYWPGKFDYVVGKPPRIVPKSSVFPVKNDVENRQDDTVLPTKVVSVRSDDKEKDAVAAVATTLNNSTKRGTKRGKKEEKEKRKK